MFPVIVVWQEQSWLIPTAVHLSGDRRPCVLQTWRSASCFHRLLRRHFIWVWQGNGSTSAHCSEARDAWWEQSSFTHCFLWKQQNRKPGSLVFTGGRCSRLSGVDIEHLQLRAPVAGVLFWNGSAPGQGVVSSSRPCPFSNLSLPIFQPTKWLSSASSWYNFNSFILWLNQPECDACKQDSWVTQYVS